MMHLMMPQRDLTVIIGILATGAIGSLLLRKRDAPANLWGHCCALTGSTWGVYFGIANFLANTDHIFSLGTGLFASFSLSFHINRLSAFFFFVISFIALVCSIYGIGYCRHYYRKYSLGALGFFYNAFILGMLVVVTANNGLFFLIAWEIMSVASYFLVVYDRHDAANIKAGFLYLVMTHVGTAFIIIALVLADKYTGSFDFDVIASNAARIPAAVKNVMFVTALIGFGAKAGIIPFHIWLPNAHPAAPSHVSALMSGVMIKTGIYMMIKMFLDVLQPAPLWWGLVVLAIGSLSALLGVLYALTENDIKRLLAYCSIENIGIILLGLGSALSFSSIGMPQLALLGLVAALFHTLNHATFKALLFLSAGAVINETHTRNLEKYGGIIARMPQTALFFLIGSMAISALPPFNGFFSEWLTFQALFQGIMALDFSPKWIFIAAAGSLAFTGGLALTLFVKAFGATFLARPRSQVAQHAKDPAITLRIAMSIAAVACLAFGLSVGYITSRLDLAGRQLRIFADAPPFHSLVRHQGLDIAGFSTIAAPLLCAIFIIAFFVVVIATNYLINKEQKVSRGATWDCGADLTPHMEITATGFSHSIITIFRRILKPSIQHETEYHDVESRYLPASRMVTLTTKDIHLSYLYKPLNKVVAMLSERMKQIQSGNINIYILYIFIALLGALLLVK
jgi:hydrogenase-4 component B